MMPQHWRPLAHERHSIFKCKEHTYTLHTLFICWTIPHKLTDRQIVGHLTTKNWFTLRPSSHWPYKVGNTAFDRGIIFWNLWQFFNYSEKVHVKCLFYLVRRVNFMLCLYLQWPKCNGALNLDPICIVCDFFSLNIFLFEMTLSWKMMEDEANILSRYLHLKKQLFDCFKTTAKLRPQWTECHCTSHYLEAYV